jgi:hypothetical protein
MRGRPVSATARDSASSASTSASGEEGGFVAHATLEERTRLCRCSATRFAGTTDEVRLQALGFRLLSHFRSAFPHR